MKKINFGSPYKGDIAKKCQIKPSTTTIIKTKENIMKVAESDTKLKFKFIRKLKYEGVGKSVWVYFLDLRGKNVPVSGDMLIKKAMTLLLQIGFKDFCASQGWLQKFKRRLKEEF